MSECNLALNANINQKEQPNTLYVHGSIMVYSSNYQISVKRTEPQGINPSILMLTLTVTELPGPMKGTCRGFSYEESGDHVNVFKQVHLQSNKGDDLTVDVEVFG